MMIVAPTVTRSSTSRSTQGAMQWLRTSVSPANMTTIVWFASA
jgi:hypothetical protein